VTGWRSVLLLAGCLAALAGTASPAAARTAEHHRLFAFTDGDIIESSGLVDRGDRVFTINDSGDGPVVYGVDPRSGATVSRTTYSSGQVEDVEALAPGPGGALWVGDLGDNRANRDDVSVYRMRPARSGDVTVPATRYGLTYPGGARDAETLLVQPRTGRVFVVSKSVFGGTVYAAPRRLHQGTDNRLRPFARVDGLVTDGTFFPDGRHVLLRTYATASVYTFPDFRLVGTVRLPSQPQGEGVSVGPHGRVLVSSEGLHTPVLEVSLPARLTHPRHGAAPSGPAPDTKPAPPPQSRAPARDAWDWLEIGLVAVGVAGLAAATVRLSRVRPRR
jgi:hypothetical protein